MLYSQKKVAKIVQVRDMDEFLLVDDDDDDDVIVRVVPAVPTRSDMPVQRDAQV